MTHPYDRLPDYVAGDLDADERARVETHLAGCEACRREVRAMERAFVAMVEGLPQVRPSEATWQAIAARLAPTTAARRAVPAGAGADIDPAIPAVSATPPVPRPGPRLGFALAAALALAVAIGVWGVDQRRQASALQERLTAAERSERVLSGWLSRNDVQRVALPVGDDGRAAASFLVLSDGRALLVARGVPEPGRTYQVWGIEGGQAISLGVTDARLLEVSYEGFDTLGLSLEPAGGSATPTDVLGIVGL